MKKHQFLVSCVMAFLAAAVMDSIAFAAEVVYVEGNVQVQSSSDYGWKTAEKGMILNVGDLIRTARHSMADIALDMEKKNTVRIEQKTLVSLNSATPDTLDRLDLAKGKVYANLESIKAGLTFEVNTPSAVAGVRGSALSVYVERDSDEIVAYKDTVFIKAFDVDKQLISEVMLPEGFKTFIERFGEPSVFSQISNREFGRFDNNMEDLSNNIEGKMNLRMKAAEARKESDKEQAKSEEERMTDQVTEQQDILDEVADTQNTEDFKSEEIVDMFRYGEHG